MILEFGKDISRFYGKNFSFGFKVIGEGKNLNLTIDIYPFENPQHPERHLAYWVFENIVPSEEYFLEVNLNEINEKSVCLIKEGNKIFPSHFWKNQSGFYEPVLDFQFVIRENTKIKRIIHSNLIVEGSRRIEKFYTQESGGEYKIDTLNLTFHNHRMRVLKNLFKKHIKKNYIVLDAGSGISVFSLIFDKLPFLVYAADLKFKNLSKRQTNLFYINSNVENLPFKDDFFDFVYSGEVIEHLYSPKSFLNEINRVLKENGIFVLTTPNSNRLINRVRGVNMPLSSEHINEMNINELEAILKYAGFEIIEKKGIYLELFLNYFNKEDTYDFLQAKFNKPLFTPIMKFLMKIGEFFPSYALDLIIVAKKKV